LDVAVSITKNRVPLESRRTSTTFSLRLVEEIFLLIVKVPTESNTAINPSYGLAELVSVYPEMMTLSSENGIIFVILSERVPPEIPAYAFWNTSVALSPSLD